MWKFLKQQKIFFSVDARYDDEYCVFLAIGDETPRLLCLISFACSFAFCPLLSFLRFVSLAVFPLLSHLCFLSFALALALKL